MHRDGEFTEVESASDCIRKVAKDPDAVWVGGLRPNTKQQDAINNNKKWLLRSFVVMLISCGVCIVQLSQASTLYRFDFALDDVPLWPELRNISLMQVMLSHILPLVQLALIGTVCFDLAMVADLFQLFCGIGIVFLGLLAAIGDIIVMLMACRPGVAPNGECFFPITLHLICSYTKYCSAYVALLSTSVVWDELRMARQKIRMWRYLLAVPGLLILAQLILVYTKSSSTPNIFGGSLLAYTAGVTLTAAKCRMQAPFLISNEKPHAA